MTNIPEWVNADLSETLPRLREKGESQGLEFMSRVPDNTKDLANEIAALATAGGGIILLGVSDDGELVGLAGLEEPKGRDDLVKRIEGICHGTVKPSITPVLYFAQESGKVVLMIEIQKRTEPVYYAGNIPYIRHLRESRPADPHEVVHRVLAWRGVALLDSETQFVLVTCDVMLIEILVYTSECSERLVNPWMRRFGKKLSMCSEELRKLIHKKTLHQFGDLKQIPKLCDELAGMVLRPVSGTWPAMEELAKRLNAAVVPIHGELRSALAHEDSAKEDGKEFLEAFASRARDLHGRSDALIDSGRLDDFIDEASRLGKELLGMSYSHLDFLPETAAGKLQEAARRLHLVETIKLSTGGATWIEATRATVLKTAKVVAEALRS